MSESAGDRHTEMRQQGYDADAIRRAPDLERGGEGPGVVEVQNFLKHYGYFDFGPAAAQAAPPERGRMDDKTVRALVEFQMRYNVGTLGVLDAPTRELMAAPRCGLPDLDGGSSIRFATACAWDRRTLSYQFGQPGASMITSDLPQGVVINAVRRALDTWAGAGAGLKFKVITGGDIGIDADIRIEWRPAADPDYSMAGSAIAHADYPPGCSVVTNDYPKPLHFDDGESWVDGAVAGKYDIETVALHELGHLLGLKHNSIPGTVMYEYTSANSTLRELQTDDALGIRALYPVAPLFPIFLP
jgi:Matrixin/Putative peptidoglycan binding domain